MGIRVPIPIKNSKKRPENLGRLSPRMFYTPDEVECKEDIVEMAFTNTRILPINLKSELYERKTISQIKMFRLTYEKVILKNANYDYLYVQKNQKELFLSLYLDSNKDGNTKTQSKKYI